MGWYSFPRGRKILTPLVAAAHKIFTEVIVFFTRGYFPGRKSLLHRWLRRPRLRYERARGGPYAEAAAANSIKFTVRQFFLIHAEETCVTLFLAAAMQQIWQKVATFIYPTCIRRRGIRRNFAKVFITGKAGMIRLPHTEESMIICQAV